MAEETFTPKVVLALIVKDGRFLLIRRKVQLVKALRWAFPGGIVGEAETGEESLIRHIKSEVGLDVEIKARILERVHPDTFVKIVYFHCESKDSKKPKIGEPHEIAEVSWIPAKGVLDKFTSDVAPEIQKFIGSYGH